MNYLDLDFTKTMIVGFTSTGSYIALNKEIFDNETHAPTLTLKMCHNKQHTVAHRPKPQYSRMLKDMQIKTVLKKNHND